MLVHQPLRGVPAERRTAGQALIKRGRGRVHIPGRRGRPAAELLRRRVRQRARSHRPVPGPHGDAEIRQLAGALRVDQHVLGLVIPVHHAAPVRGGQAEQRALQHDQRRLRRGLALPGQDLPQRDPVDELHHDRRARWRFHVLVQPDHVRVRHGGQHRRLGAEHPGELRVGQQLQAQVLDRHQGARRVVPGQHHLTETARAQRLHLGITRDIPLSCHQVPTHRRPTPELGTGRRQSPPDDGSA